jgi:hypothetical protein
LRDETNSTQSNKKNYHKVVDHQIDYKHGTRAGATDRRIDSKLNKSITRQSTEQLPIAGVVRKECVAGFPNHRGT